MAQLVARLVRNEKVRGSNPLSSTTFIDKVDFREESTFVIPAQLETPRSFSQWTGFGPSSTAVAVVAGLGPVAPRNADLDHT